eukprot:6058200-Pleurochrysis_carterae.AAC.1
MPYSSAPAIYCCSRASPLLSQLADAATTVAQAKRPLDHGVAMRSGYQLKKNTKEPRKDA